MGGSGGNAQPRLGPDMLIVERPLFPSPGRASIQLGDDDRDEERERHGKERRMVVRKDGRGVLPSTAFHTPGDRMTSSTAAASPVKAPHSAPLVVNPRQVMERMSTGKLADAATPKVSATMNARFWFSKTIPSTMATIPIATAAILETRTSSRSLTRPLRITFA